jgi:beta-phosphoglucomutase-like phosphatase (HAD superfamily)
VLEDSVSGIAAGIAAGMKVVATTAAMPAPGHPGHHDAQRAHRVVPGLAELDEGFLRAIMASGAGRGA